MSKIYVSQPLEGRSRERREQAKQAALAAYERAFDQAEKTRPDGRLDRDEMKVALCSLDLAWCVPPLIAPACLLPRACPFPLPIGCA